LTHFVVLKSYEAIVHVDRQDAVIGEIRHVQRNAAGGSVSVQVAYFRGYIPQPEEGLHPHWRVALFIRSAVRYDRTTDTTTFASLPEPQAGVHPGLLHRFRAQAKSHLPYCDPRLPAAFSAALIAATYCTEPLFLSIYHAAEAGGFAVGAVFDEE
jgi:hypothetical protein